MEAENEIKKFSGLIKLFIILSEKNPQTNR